jgi:hypothetical protein
MLIECADRLGDLTDELKPGVYMTEFVSAGPKNYAYKICERDSGKENTVCKARVITLNYSASRFVNFDVIKDMILKGGTDDTVTVHTDKKIKIEALLYLLLQNLRTRFTGFVFKRDGV